MHVRELKEIVGVWNASKGKKVEIGFRYIYTYTNNIKYWKQLYTARQSQVNAINIPNNLRALSSASSPPISLTLSSYFGALFLLYSYSWCYDYLEKPTKVSDPTCLLPYWYIRCNNGRGKALRLMRHFVDTHTHMHTNCSYIWEYFNKFEKLLKRTIRESARARS